MPVPNLLHPVDVILRIRRSDLTLMDEDFEEPIGKVARDEEITLPGQIYWQDQVWEMGNTGVQERTLGYCLFRTMDLQAASQGYTLEQGDQIIKIGNLDVNYYLYRFEHRGHYPQLGATLVKCWFAAEAPVREK